MPSHGQATSSPCSLTSRPGCSGSLPTRANLYIISQCHPKGGVRSPEIPRWTPHHLSFRHHQNRHAPSLPEHSNAWVTPSGVPALNQELEFQTMLSSPRSHTHLHVLYVHCLLYLFVTYYSSIISLFQHHYICTFSYVVSRPFFAACPTVSVSLVVFRIKFESLARE